MLEHAGKCGAPAGVGCFGWTLPGVHFPFRARTGPGHATAVVEESWPETTPLPTDGRVEVRRLELLEGTVRTAARGVVYKARQVGSYRSVVVKWLSAGQRRHATTVGWNAQARGQPSGAHPSPGIIDILGLSGKWKASAVFGWMCAAGRIRGTGKSGARPARARKAAILHAGPVWPKPSTTSQQGIIHRHKPSKAW